jgi:hypothetical protein
MNNQIFLEQLLQCWPQVKLLNLLPGLDKTTTLCTLNFKGHKVLLLLDSLICTSSEFTQEYLRGRMNQMQTLMIKLGCLQGILMTVNKDLPAGSYQTAQHKKIELVDFHDLQGLCQKLNCDYLTQFLTVHINLDLLETLPSNK